MKATVILASLTVLAVIILAPTILTSEQASAQMMNPNMMNNPNMMKMMRNFTGNGSWTVNPNMINMMRNLTGNASWTPDNIGPMMMNPNMMNMMRNMMMANGWTPDNMGPMIMNPNFMMPDSSLIGSMMVAGQNVTGSINPMDSMIKSVTSQIKVNLTDAIATAQKQLGEKSRVIAANLGINNGYLTYTIRAIDPDMNMQMLIIDPANGKVLLTQKMPSFRMMGPNMMSMMGGMMNPNMMGGMMTPWMMSHMWH